MTEKTEIHGRPVWWTRQYLEPFVLSEEEAWRIINSPPWYCVISWVTKNCEPVSCAMAYLVMDGKIMLCSTSNRDKVKAFRRNPAVSLCFQGKGLKQVTVRGHVELSVDRELVRRWVEAHVDSWGLPMTPEERQLQIDRYDSPGRLIIIVHVDKMRTFDGEKMFQAEKQNLDV
ncbi:MAG: pyridoxamine 5'-phosphate oxidase family protein [Acidobacteria bacterium]|nr:pyridoxamine 5'-phosphate oxidase family protein [Acidobacteriota bacterium]